MLHGKGIFTFKQNGEEIRIPNIIVDDGEETYLKMIFQGDVAVIPLGGNFFLGLCGEVAVAPDAILADITDEPTTTNGYARQAIERNTTGFPTVDTVNGVKRAKSKDVIFTATGGDFSVPITRAFLCDVVLGSAGLLFAFSGKLPNPITVSPGTPLTTFYECYFDGS